MQKLYVKTLRLLSLFSLCFLFVTTVKASHAVGAEISYECLGPNQYRVYLKFYRDCSGVSAGSSHTVTYSSASCGVSSSISLSQVGSAIDITPVCPTQSTSCGGGSGYGVEEYVYRGILNLPPGCGNDWVLGWSICCRNYGITTLGSPGGQSMYVSSLLDNTLTPCNTSPSFQNPPAAMFCANQASLYNPGAVDADGDSLVFSLANCRQNAGGSVGYNGGFSGVNPLSTTSGITIDPQTGAIAFTPSQTQIGVLCVRVEEYRNGVKIGEIVRDIQFNVVTCNNNPPVLTGMNGTTDFDTTICVGANLCFNINSFDPNGDPMVLTWNNGIPGGSLFFTGNGGTSPSAQFCWSPTPADAGSHFFTITVEDDACPITGQNTFTYQIDVYLTPNTVNAGVDQDYCDGASANLGASSSGGVSYLWSPPTNLSNPNIANPVADPNVTTVYTVTATFPDGCRLQDNMTVTVNPLPAVTINPQVVWACPGGSVTLTASAPTANSYLWSTGATTSTITVSPGGTTDYWVDVTDANGCTSRDSSLVNVNAPTNNVCNVVYAAPGASGVGTSADPANLSVAISMAGCNNTVVKCAIGTYTIDTVINNITSSLTIEGGFDRGNNWEKVSTPGATTIFRSTLNPDGVAQQQRLVAIQMNNASQFRFQDITIQVANANLPGESTYGVHMTSCSDYFFTRTQVFAGNGGQGQAGASGSAGVGGNGGGGGAAGENDNQSNSGAGGGGGAGAGGGGGGGAGAPNPPGCCSTGFTGSNGNNAPGGTPRSGGGGGGGGSGGEEDRDGGRGGRGGVGGGGAVGGAQGTAGDSDGCSSGDCGGTGGAGGNGLAGSNGSVGPNGSHVGGYWVPGGSGGTGGNGTGGGGGGAGGGGGGQGGTFCTDGAGSGGGGGGGGGQGGTGGFGGLGGGSSFSVYLFNNGANGRFDDCNVTNGAAGSGGNGGGGGAGGPGGNGGNGSTYTGGEVGCGGNGGRGGNGGIGGSGGSGRIGQATQVHQAGGTGLAQNDINFNLAGLPTITMENISCTNTDIDYGGINSQTWDLDLGATPRNPTGINVTTQYSSIGRRDIFFGASLYTGFSNVIQASNIFPDIGTNCPQVAGVYRICAGTPVNFWAQNGGLNYLYDWNMGGGTTPNTFNGIQYDSLNNMIFNTPGSYWVTLSFTTDCCGLSPRDSVEIFVDAQPVLSVVGGTDICEGDTFGVMITASGADNYLWAPSAGLSSTTAAMVNAQPTTTTTYTVTGSNTLGTCYDVSTHTVTVNGFTMTGSFTNATCGGNGSATVTPAGGSGSYSYLWPTNLGSQTTQTATNVPAGTYIVVVTDNVTGCVDSIPVSVAAGPGALLAYISNTTNISCNGNTDGTATVAHVGGVGPFSYSWTGGGGTNATTGPLPPGTYTATVTDQSNGCTSMTSTTITEPPPLAFNLLSVDTATCTYTADGGAVVNASGGTGPYSFTWRAPLTSTTQTITNVLPGVYRVVVVDSRGCTDSIDVTIPTHPQPPVDLGNDTTICSNTTLTLDATDPSITSYLWNTTAVTPNISVSTAGIYWVEVSDGNCTVRDSITVSVDQVPVVSFGNDTTLCTGDQLVLDATLGGSATYLWQDASTNPTFTVSTAGTYSVTVDSGACSVFEDIVVSYDPPPIVNLGPDVTECQGTVVTLDATTAGATYIWQDASTNPTFNPTTTGTYWVDVTLGACTVRDSADITFHIAPVINFGPDTALCVSDVLLLDATVGGTATYTWQDASTNPTFNVTGPGTYNVTVDSGACSVFEEIVVTYDTPPVVNFGNNVTLCQGQTRLLDATVGGTATYLWQDNSTNPTFNVTSAGTYTVIIDSGACQVTESIVINYDLLPVVDFGPDTALCAGDILVLDATLGGTATYLWQDASTNPTFTVTGPGTYNVTIDSGACQVFEEIIVSYDALPVVSFGNDTTLCQGENLVLDATLGGSATYLWQDASTNPTFNVTSAGTYTVVVDSGACQVTESIVVDYHLLPAISFGPDTALCAGDALLLDATLGGTATYLWQDASTNPTFNVTGPGTYNVTVDSGVCQIFEEIIVSYDNPPVVDLGNDTTICAGQVVNLDATVGGTATYTWQDASTLPTYTVTTAGLYTVTVDSGACTVTDNINVSVDQPPTVSFGPDVALCQGETLVLDATTAGATYLWQDNSTNPTFTVTTAGTYSVDVTRGACTITEDITITFDAPPVVDIGADTTLCDGQVLTLDATTAGATYRWWNNSPNATVDVSRTGTYSVDVTVGACTVTDVINVTFEDPPRPELGRDQDLCAGGIIVLDATVPGNVSYLWQDGSTDPTFMVDTAGTFYVTASEGVCVGTDTVTITLLPVIGVLDIGNDTSICETDVITLTASDPAVTNYLWSTGSRESSIEVNDAGTYWVRLRNECGVERDTINVSYESCDCHLYFPTAFTPNGDGLNEDFKPTYDCELADYSLSVYNRWGVLIWETNNASEGWDAFYKSEIVQQGVYVWKTSYSFARGANVGKTVSRAGSVTVVR